MTCKECIHYEVCGKGVDGAMDRDQMAFESRCPRVEFDCPHFKPKSRFVELPCEVGQTVYMPFEGEVTQLSIFRVSVVLIMDEEVIIFCDAKSAKVGTSFSHHNIGKTVFLSREEAEKALKERESE